jgi:hypothetical protein
MQMPAKWKYMKLDLFNNASTEELVQGKNKWAVTLNVLVQNDPEYKRFTAKLNCPRRSVKRGTKHLWNTPHFKLVQRLMGDLDGSDYRVSKFYDTNRDTNYGLTGFLILDTDPRQFVLIYDEQVMHFEFDGRGLTQRQRDTGIVGTFSNSAGKFTSDRMKMARDVLG